MESSTQNTCTKSCCALGPGRGAEDTAESKSRSFHYKKWGETEQ